MKQQIKKLFCLILTAASLLSIFTVFASAAEEDVFFGYIQALGVNKEELGWYRAARDEDDKVYIHGEDFAVFADGDLYVDKEYDSGAPIYRYHIGNWYIYVDTSDNSASLSMRFESSLGIIDYFRRTFTLSGSLYNDGSWYFPLEEMMYMACMEWYCQNNTVFAYRPETLLDIICETKTMLNNTVKTTDLLGEDTISQLGNSFKYGFLAAIDEINMTFICDSVITTFSDEASMTYEIDNISSALLTLMSDVPENKNSMPANDSGIFKFIETVGTVMDIETTEDAARLEWFNNFVYKIAHISPLDEATANAASKVSGAYGISASTLSYLVSVTKALEMREKMPADFKDRLKFIEETAASRKSADTFFLDLEKAAKQTYDLYYTDVLEAFKQNITLDTVTGYITGAAGFSEGLSKVAWPLCYANLTVGSINLVINGLSLIPAVSEAFDNGENAYLALNLMNISTAMKSRYLDNATKIAYADAVSGKLLDTVRLSAECMMSAALHAHEKVVGIGNATVPSGGYKEALYLQRLSESALYDDLLFFSPNFSNIRDKKLDCSREEIPPEYVFYRLPVLETSADPGEKNVLLKPTVFCNDDSNIPEVYISADDNGWGQILHFEIEHEFCENPYVIETTYSLMGVLSAVDVGDGEYTYIFEMYCAGTRGGTEIHVLKVIDGELKPVMIFDEQQRYDQIYVEGTFVSSSTVKGYIHPTMTPFEAVVSYPLDERTGTSIWENGTGIMSYELNADGYYDLIFHTNERNLSNADGIGGSHSRYVYKDGKFILTEQWYTAW
ncbi:MAG: hypothetical protein IJC81_00235 [Clostridia bacterium]|nr:hypothetical protein [Clostridia bacterium]